MTCMRAEKGMEASKMSATSPFLTTRLKIISVNEVENTGERGAGVLWTKIISLVLDLSLLESVLVCTAMTRYLQPVA